MAKIKKSKPATKKQKNAHKKSAKKSYQPQAKSASVESLSTQVAALSDTLNELMPLHLKAADGPSTGMLKVGLQVQDGSPEHLSAWVEDELVLRHGKRSGESRPRPIGETVIVTVEADGNPDQPIRIELVNLDVALYADHVPSDDTHYEGGDRFTVKAS